MKTTVANMRTHPKDDPNAVYIGRPSKWGNPRPMRSERERDAAIEAYRHWLTINPRLVRDAKAELKGKTLLCYCHPKPCHGDLLAEIANEA